MSVDVDKIKDKFLNRINDKFNSEVYFLDTCRKFPEKYPLHVYVSDLSLRIFFEENNKISLCGTFMKFCEKDAKKTVKLAALNNDISSSDVTTINNYIVEDKWNQIDW